MSACRPAVKIRRTVGPRLLQFKFSLNTFQKSKPFIEAGRITRMFETTQTETAMEKDSGFGRKIMIDPVA